MASNYQMYLALIDHQENRYLIYSIDLRKEYDQQNDLNINEGWEKQSMTL